MSYTVTQMASIASQPRGGFLPLRLFQEEMIEDGAVLNERENISPALVGMAVDILTRASVSVKEWSTGDVVRPESDEKLFNIAYAGAKALAEARMLARASDIEEPIDLFKSLAGDISSTDDASIVAACKLSSFEACGRRGLVAYKPVEEIEPDAETIENIRIMAERSLDFFEANGPVTMLGPTFEGGYTRKIVAGDGDILTYDCIWDIKTIKNKPRKEHLLQLYLYYLMAQKANDCAFLTVKSMGIFNPRLNVAYSLDPSTVDKDIERVVQTEVIGYEWVEERGEAINVDQFSIRDWMSSDACQELMERLQQAE